MTLCLTLRIDWINIHEFHGNKRISRLGGEKKFDSETSIVEKHFTKHHIIVSNIDERYDDIDEKIKLKW